MPYEVQWEIPQAVLCLRLLDRVTVEEFVGIDRAVNEYLNTISPGVSIALLIDASKATNIPQAYAQVQLSQTYAHSYSSNARLKYILVVCDQKLLRLLLLLIFNLCRPILEFFDTDTQAMAFLVKSGYREPER